MNRLSILMGLFACLLLVASAEPAFADCLGGGGGNKRGTPTRAGISPLGVGLAGIGLSWGVMWIGTRVAGWVARKEPKDRSPAPK